MRYLPFTLLLLVLAATLGQPAAAQPPGSLLTTWTLGTPEGSGTGNWNTGSNWSGGAVPDINTFDSAVINAGGTAQVNTNILPNAGGVVLGAAAGNSGTLDILAGGSLSALDDGPGFPADGSVRVGQSGTGTLRISPGGTLTSTSLSVGGEIGSSMTLGSTVAGSTIVNTGAVTLGRTTRVIGPNVNFTSSGTGAGIAFQGSSVFIPEITAGTHSPLKTTGSATLGGTLQLDFTGHTPTSTSFWNLIDAASVNGTFASVLPDPDAPLGPGQVLNTRTVNGGNGKLVQLFVNQLAVLTVNRDTRTVAITNPGGTGIAMDGYTIRSANGAISPGNWVSLQDSEVAGAGWSEANPTGSRVSEIRSAGVSTLGGSGSWALGNMFQRPTPTAFGEEVEDITFQYTQPGVATIDGVVNYTGSAGVNNLVLFVDPATGNVKIRNTSPFNVAIEAYTITSTDGSLNSNPALWTSLQNQPGAAGPGWAEANLSDTRVSELKSTAGATPLNANGGTTFDLGGLFETAGDRDLQFEFLLAGESIANTGLVLYEAAPPVVGVNGDYNNNGTVDAADYVLWRRGGPLTNDPTPGVQNPGDYNFWRSRFGAFSNGAGSGGGSSIALVPEPATCVLALSMVGLAMLASRRRS